MSEHNVHNRYQVLRPICQFVLNYTKNAAFVAYTQLGFKSLSEDNFKFSIQREVPVYDDISNIQVGTETLKQPNINSDYHE